jgi:signal transduction histidine kinase
MMHFCRGEPCAWHWGMFDRCEQWTLEILDELLAPYGRNLDARTRGKLLAASQRMVPIASLAGVVVPVLVMLGFSDDVEVKALLTWTATMLVLSVLTFVAHQRYTSERRLLTPAEHTARWWPRMRIHSLALGLGWGAAALMHPYATSATFAMVLFVLMLCVLAVAASSHASIPSNLALCAAPVLLAAFVMAGVTFPEQILYVAMLVMAYACLLGYHALSTYRTLCREIAIERGSRRVARRFYEERKRALAASEEKSRFLAAASHDLRQPVHALVMLVEALRARNRSEDLKPLVEQVAAGAQTIDLLFRSLLDLSKLEGRRQLPELQPCNVTALIDEVVDQFQSDAQAEGLTLEGNRESGLMALAEPVLLRRALHNLVQNALRYTPAGSVVIRGRIRKGKVRLEVWDTGVGIAPAHTAEIFSPYFQVENAHRDLSQGLGLGLAIFRECVRLMRGRFGVRSLLGRGSVFWFSLEPAGEGAVERVQDRAIDTPAFSGTVLVVDDDRQVRDAWTALLEAWGVSVKCVDDGVGADASLAEGLRPDVILCDLRLPGPENGLQLMERLHVSHPNAHVALLSGDSRSQAFLAAEEAGYMVLPKPIDMDGLRVLLRRWLPGPGTRGA